MLKCKHVMDYNFVADDMEKFANEVHNKIKKSQKCFIVTANPEIISFANSNASYKEAIDAADYIIPDGIGIILASRILGKPLNQRLTGFDFSELLLNLANKKRYSIYFLGAKEEIIPLTVKNIERKFPNITIAGYHHGFFRSDDESIIREIKATNPDIVLVGLGVPKQERWISKNIHQFDKGIFIGIGGSFNVWAGVVKRAPKFWRNLNLEWLYRLILEPSRLKRAVSIPIFLIQVLKRKYKL